MGILLESDRAETGGLLWGDELPSQPGIGPALLSLYHAHGVGQHEAEDSVSFARVLRNEDFTRAPMIHHSSRGGFAIRAGDWKLVAGVGSGAAVPKNGQMELYDLKDDPAETMNVIGQHPEVAERLKDQITEIILNGRTRKGSKARNDTPVKMWWRK